MDAQAPRPAHGGQWREGGRLVLWLLLCLAGAWLLLLGGGTDPAREGAEGVPLGERRPGYETIDVKQAIGQLRAADPECIGIGNSMMFTRLGMTPEAMTELTGKKFFFLYKPGSDAPIWYLLLKNVVAASGVRPKVVFLFVRDDELTRPCSAKIGEFTSYVNSLRSVDEPELDRYTGKRRPGVAGANTGLAAWLGDPLVLDERRQRMTRRLTDLAMDMGGGRGAKKHLRFSLAARFGLDHLRGDVGSDMPLTDALDLKSSSFAESTQASLLPEMVRLTSACGAKLMVFRVKRRPDPVTNLPEEPKEMREYAAFLEGWMKDHGGLCFDETYDPSIRLADYLDGDHIHPQRLGWYQGYFWERVKGLFP